MFAKRSTLLLGLLAIGSSLQAAEDLKFDDLFPRRSNNGRVASAMDWSHDDRYLAFRWNKLDTPGVDIWLYDSKTHKTEALTSPETFKPFDKEIPRKLKLFQDRLERDQKVEKMTDQEYREFLQEETKKEEARKESQPSYGGPQSFKWAHKSNEMLVTYESDLYRLKIGENKLQRLTWTREAEVQVEYLPDDSGITYRRGDGVYLIKFDSGAIRQLNPSLPGGLPLGSYSISPDGSKMMITSSKSTGPTREVDWITYRDRFAKAQKTQRGVADDKFNNELYVFLYDLKDILADNSLSDQKPWEVFKYPGGEEYWETSISEHPWSPDSSKFTFATWKRDSKAFDLIVADFATRKSQTVYAAKLDGEHRSPSLAEPFWLPDGKKIILLLESSGYRHAWSVDPLQEGATQITKGDFETFPLAATPDGKSLIVRSGKEDPARFNLYRVDIATGEYHRLTKETGNYGIPALSPGKNRAALTFGNWTRQPELVVMNAEKGGDERVITDSHRSDRFKKINVQTPELFTYTNRHGQTVHGYMFLPAGWKKEDKRPLMVYVYGGPLGTGKSVEDGSFNSTAYWFNLLLTRNYGFVTAVIDPRGQSGYGSVFGKANWEAPGVAQTEDLSDGVKHLVANYGVDPKRVALNGWSFGGFQTQMCMYSAPDVFTLGIAGAGPTEWQNYNTWYSGGVIGNARDGKPEDIDKYSLTNIAKNLKSPLMLLHGVEDTNVLYQDTIKVYRKLLQYGKGHLVELSIDPTGGHGMGGDMSNRDRHLIYLEFIKKWWRL